MAKRAVLIGINKYQVPGADLQGCVNDVKNLKGALTTYYGFADKDIATFFSPNPATSRRRGGLVICLLLFFEHLRDVGLNLFTTELLHSSREDRIGLNMRVVGIGSAQL